MKSKQVLDISGWCRLSDSEKAEEFYSTIAKTERLFRDTHRNLQVFGTKSSRLIANPVDLFSAIPNLLKVVEVDKYGKLQPKRLSEVECKLLLYSDWTSLLPELKATVTDPVIAGGVLVDEPGYHRETGIYYLPMGDKRPQVSRETKYLEKCFSDVPFASPADRSNFFAWLIGGVCLDPFLHSPMMAITANSRNVGKSSLAFSAGIILTGEHPTPVSPKRSEMSKQLGASFLSKKRCVIFDNVKARGEGFDDPQLAQLLTEGFSKSVRILGKSRMVALQGVLFASTMNDCKLSADLATRSILVRLYREEAKPMVPYCVEYASQNRNELYGELLGLALDEPGEVVSRPCPEFRFARWKDFILPRVEPRFGPTCLFQISSADEVVRDFLALCQSAVDGDELIEWEFSATDVVEQLEIFYDSYKNLSKLLADAPSKRAKETKLGRFLTDVAKQPEIYSFDGLGKYKVQKLSSSTQGRRMYCIKKV